MGEVGRIPKFKDIHTFKISDDHENYISALKFSRNGEFLAAVSNTFVRVWKLSGSPGLKFDKASPLGGLHDVAWTNDGQKFVAAAQNGNIVLYDLDEPNVEEVVGSHTGPVFCCDVNPLNGNIASGGADGYVRQWSIQNGQRISLTQNLVDQALVTAVRYSSSGSSLVCGGSDGILFHFKTATMGNVPRVDPHTVSSVSSLEFVPNSENCVVVGRVDQSIKLWDLEQPRIIKTFTREKGRNSSLNNYLFRAHFVATNMNQFIISGSALSSVFIWNTNRPDKPIKFWTHLETLSRGKRGNSAEVILATDTFKATNANFMLLASTSIKGQFVQVHKSENVNI